MQGGTLHAPCSRRRETARRLGGRATRRDAAPQVPCATTLCVVALGAGEARVEALGSQFVQLREAPGAAAAAAAGAPGGAGAELTDLFMFDDDDLYQVRSTRSFPSDHSQESSASLSCPSILCS